MAKALESPHNPTHVMEAAGFRIGLDPLDHVFVMENHDNAYYVWPDAGLKHRILIHIDAHHDMWWVEDREPVTIANFICRALKEDLVREVYWVVPDPAWEGAKNRKTILRHLRGLKKTYPGAHHAPQIGANQISTVVLGKPVRICPLGSLPRVDESVLLDIDSDFFVIPRVSYGENDTHAALPWCWPQDMLARLCARNIRADSVTIAYSGEGGFTPLKWKYLGDELALRLRRPNHSEPIIQGMGLIREAATAAHRGDFVTAEAKYHEARHRLPTSPAPYYHLAHLYVEMGRIEEGQKFYQRALTLDPSYRTPYSNAGLHYYWNGRFREAEGEYLRALALDPQGPYAHLGMGQLAAQKKRWSEAEALLSKALSLDGHLTDAYRVLGDVLVKQGRQEEPIATFPGGDNLFFDSDHCRIHARLAHLYELKGAISEAINGYRISIAGKYDGVLLRSRLARLYLKKNQWQQSAQEARQAVKMIPFDLRKAGRRLRRHLRLRLKSGLSVGRFLRTLKRDG